MMEKGESDVPMAEKIKTLSPVVLFCYNRVEYLIQTVMALRANELADQSDLIIFSDGPKNEQDAEKVRAVREYIHLIRGFRKVEIHESPVNKGLANSVIAGVTEVVNRYGKVIVLEDDLVTSPCFLRFMNEALDLYQDEERVCCIHGFSWNTKEKLPDTFFLRGADCWGWATWKRGWDLFEPSAEKLLASFRAKPELIPLFDFNGSYPYFKMLENQKKGTVDSWAIRWQASAFLADKLTLHSGNNLIQNIGLAGTHIRTEDHFPKITGNRLSFPIPEIPVKADERAYRLYADFFKSASPAFSLSGISGMLRRAAGKILPDSLKSFLHRCLGEENTWKGNYESLESAQKDAVGYDAANILEKVKEATKEVIAGNAVFERDSVLFFHEEPNYPLISSLLFAMHGKEELRLLDFGGSLGSVYFQNRKFLSCFRKISWEIVEQKHFTEAGRELLKDFPEIRFRQSVEEVFRNGKPDIALFSSVLQYLPDFQALLQKAMDAECDYILIDRTPVFTENEKRRYCIQHVSPNIYKGTYAVQIFGKNDFGNILNSRYQLLDDFLSYRLTIRLGISRDHAEYRGQLWKRKS